MLASRDRVYAGRLVEVTHLDPEGKSATQERDHDAAVAGVAAAFLQDGMAAVGGWRWVVSWQDGQLVPDLWVLLPGANQEEGTWTPVEVEFSAKSEHRIDKKKLRSYRLASIRLNGTFPLLVITNTASAAARFDDLAGDVLIFTTTLKQFLTGVWEGPDSVWRRRGLPVGLTEIGGEHRPHLQQLVGRRLDHGNASPEVWRQFAGRESVSADPQAEDIDREFSPPGPELWAETDRLETETTAGPSGSKTVPVQTPPTAPPAQIRKALTTREKLLLRWDALGRMDPLLATVDRLAAARMDTADLPEAEMLCLQRMRVIMSYGIHLYRGPKRELLDIGVQIYQESARKHKAALGSINPLWRLALTPTWKDPRRAFGELLKQAKGSSRYTSRWQLEQCKLMFNGWFETVEYESGKPR